MIESLIISFLLGVVLASFTISLAEQPLSSLWRPSICDGCGHPLKIKQLVPVFSSFLKTICKCGHRPSLKYGILEALLGFIFFTNTLVFDAAPFGVLLNVFSLVSFYISLVDWKTLQIPFVSLFFLIILSGLWSYFKGQIPISVFIMFAGTTLFYFVWKFVTNTKPTGTADIFLFILSGFWLSLNLIPFFLFLTGLCGIISFKFFNGIDGKFPFAPAILLALWATILMSISLSECIP